MQTITAPWGASSGCSTSRRRRPAWPSGIPAARHPRGLVCLRLLEARVRCVMEADGFLEVRTPQLLEQSLWERSGHWQAFREGLFVVPGTPPGP